MTQVTALKEREADQLGKIDTLESHERDILDNNRHLQIQIVAIRVEKKCHEFRDVESTKAVVDAKVELANKAESLHVLQARHP